MPKVRFAPEGWLFIIPAVILTALSLLIQWWIAAIVFGFLRERLWTGLICNYGPFIGTMPIISSVSKY